MALDRNTHLGEMIGAWAGRQAEEELAQGFNRTLVDRVWDVWEKRRDEVRQAEFVNLADEDLEDPVLAEAWKLVPAETRDYIRQKFGEDGFMVRRDMVNNTIGYREASVGDVWTGLSRKLLAHEVLLDLRGSNGAQMPPRKVSVFLNK